MQGIRDNWREMVGRELDPGRAFGQSRGRLHCSLSLVRAFKVVSICRRLLQSRVWDVCLFTGLHLWLEKV